jgi:hypothetical protein
VRNARDAGARRIFVASTLQNRRYRTLTVLDDGSGIPETHAHLIFEPGVTTRHLRPVTDPNAAPHGAGLSLYHVKNAAISVDVLSTASPTAIKATFDTHTLPERTLQSGSRPSKSNLPATLQAFAANEDLDLYYASPARILSTLLHNHIIQKPDTTPRLWERATSLGLDVSLRTVQRIWRGEIGPVRAVAPEDRGTTRKGKRLATGPGDGPVLSLGEEESGAVADILRRAARASYLEVGEVEVASRPGEISVRARVYEPEEEYE